MNQKPCHILFAIHSLRTGGAERVVSILANELVRQPRYKISIVTFTNPQEPPFYPLSKKVTLIPLGDVKGAKETFLKKAYKLVVGCCRFWNVIRAQKPDVLVSFIDSMNFLSLLATRGSSIPVIVSERYDPLTYKRSRIHKWARQFLYPWASCIVVQSRSVKQFLGANLSSKIDIIGNPVSKATKKARQDVDADHIKIISVGRLIPSKRMDFLILAFEKVHKKYPKAQLIICGDGPEKEKLERIIQNRKLTKNVQLLGTVAHVEDVLSTGHIFAFSSESEGFPNALCEAMATGLAPVITDYGSSARDIVTHGKNGFVAQRDSVEEFADYLCRLIKDKRLRHKISTNAQKISDTYSVDSIVGQWEKSILKVI